MVQAGYLCLWDDGLIYKSASDIHTAVTAVQKQLEKCHNGAKEQFEISPSQVKEENTPNGL